MKIELLYPEYMLTRGSKEAAGWDLRSTIACLLSPGERILIGVGFKLEIPFGWEGQIRPRSGLALEHGITVLNAPGTVDSDYRGEIKVLLINLGQENYHIMMGERIAQIVFARYGDPNYNEQLTFKIVDSVEGTKRGEGGFGSTG